MRIVPPTHGPCRANRSPQSNSPYSLIQREGLLRFNPSTHQLDAITKAILVCLATCEELTSLVKRFKRSRSMIQNHKDRLARLIKAHLGEDILRQIQEQPGWQNDMHVAREKLACRWERSTI